MPVGMMDEIRRILRGIPVAAFGNTPAGELARFFADLERAERVDAEPVADVDP